LFNNKHNPLKIYIKQMYLKSVNWTAIVQTTDKWGSLLNTVKEIAGSIACGG